MRIPEICPITELARDARALIERARRRQEPIVITQRGRDAAVLVPIELYRKWESGIGHRIVSPRLAHPDDAERLKMTIENRADTEWGDTIVQDPAILGGEPVVRGSRIAVRSIVRAFEIYGDRGRVMEMYPSLRPDQIDAAMRFYEANPELIRKYIEENEAAAFADD